MVEFPLPMRSLVKKHSGEIGTRARQPVSMKQTCLDLDDHFQMPFKGIHDEEIETHASAVGLDPSLGEKAL
ncbi:hypothetical protein M5689_021403 [Euphorbia peplus]|nr:hypothetical protein M5689_021403 [Euphorbia peplus]